MKIEREKKQMVELRGLKNGECFSFNCRYYMKTDLNDSASTTVVALDTGYIGKFGTRTEVIPVKAKVVFE